MKKNLLIIVTILINLNVFSQLISKTGNLNERRAHHQSQILPDGKVITFGGITDLEISTKGRVCTFSEIYDPKTGKWTQGPKMNENRFNFGSIVLPNGNILAVGGETLVYDAEYDEYSIEIVTSCEIYNATTGLWELTADLIKKHVDANLVLLKNGKVLLAGGDRFNGGELYDPSNGTWSQTSTGNYSRYDASLSLLKDGRAIIIGGDESTSTEFNHRTAEIYDPETDKWTLVSSELNRGWSRHKSITLNDGRVLIFGRNYSYADIYFYSEIFDPITMTFTDTDQSDIVLAQSEAVLLSNGNVMVYTNADPFSFGETQVIHIYDVTSNKWIAKNTSNYLGAVKANVVRLSNDNFLVVGGKNFDFNPYLNTSYLINEKVLLPIEKFTEGTISLYPNPSNGHINGTITNVLKSDSSLKVEVTNSNGIIVFTKQITDLNFDLELSDLKEGLYLLNLSSDNVQVHSEKIIIQK